LADVRALKMVLLPTLGKPTIPQFRGTGTFLFYLKHGVTFHAASYSHANA
jgi:hypothetical protein